MARKPQSESSSTSSKYHTSPVKDKNDEEDKKSSNVGVSPSILKRIKRRGSGSTTTAPEGSSLNHYPENLHDSLDSLEQQYPKSLRSQFGYKSNECVSSIFKIWLNSCYNN